MGWRTGVGIYLQCGGQGAIPCPAPLTSLATLCHLPPPKQKPCRRQLSSCPITLASTPTMLVSNPTIASFSFLLLLQWPDVTVAPCHNNHDGVDFGHARFHAIRLSQRLLRWPLTLNRKGISHHHCLFLATTTLMLSCIFPSLVLPLGVASS